MSDTFTHRFADQANDVLRAVLDQTVDCIELVNLEGEIEYINPNSMRALGAGESDALTGSNWADLWPEETRERIAAAIDKARRGQQDRFDAYCPNASGDARWRDVSVSPIKAETGEITHILATSRDITQRVQERLNERIMREEAQESADRADSVAREMRHRLKNQLAVVGSVAKLLSRHTETATDLAEKLEYKLAALARAQDLLTVHREEPITAAAALEQVLGASGAGEAIELLSIPDVRLGDDGVQQLALILGELQTNSLKYGALHNEDGQITLSGSMQDRSLCLRWHEDTGRRIERPDRSGAGMKLLERLGSTADAKAAIDWHRTGPAVTFYLRTMA